MKVELVTTNNVRKYLTEIAVIHKKAYHNNHFTSTFSSEKLEEYYEELISNSDLSIVSLDDNNNCIGFIISGRNVSKGIQNFISKNKYYLFLIMLRNPIFMIEKMYFKIYSFINPPKASKIKFRLLSISVDSSNQSKGIGKFMLNEFEKKLIEINEYAYGLSVRNINIKAIKFYEKNNFIKEKEYNNSSYFIKKLKV